MFALIFGTTQRNIATKRLKGVARSGARQEIQSAAPRTQPVIKIRQSLAGLCSYAPAPMHIQPCPACDRPTARLLDDTSKGAEVNYYTCDPCGHVWTTDKDTGAILRHVTPLTATTRRLVRPALSEHAS